MPKQPFWGLAYSAILQRHAQMIERGGHRESHIDLG